MKIFNVVVVVILIMIGIVVLLQPVEAPVIQPEAAPPPLSQPSLPPLSQPSLPPPPLSQPSLPPPPLSQPSLPPPPLSQPSLPPPPLSQPSLPPPPTILNKVLSYIPFTRGEKKSTPSKDLDSTVFSLASNIHCGDKPLNQMQLVFGEDKKIRWDYTCADGGSLGEDQPLTTEKNIAPNGNLIYLDRHDARCPPNSVLSSINLNKISDNEIQWKYHCQPNKQSKPLTCRDTATPPGMASIGQLFGPGGSAPATAVPLFLTSHNIQCEPNEALSRIKFNRVGDNEMQWQYTCCS